MTARRLPPPSLHTAWAQSALTTHVHRLAAQQVAEDLRTLPARRVYEVAAEEDVQCVQQCRSMLRSRVVLASEPRYCSVMASWVNESRPLLAHRWERLELSCCISLQRLTDPAKGVGCNHRARQAPHLYSHTRRPDLTAH